MADETTPQDSAAMSPASAGSVSYRKRYDAAMELFWQKIGGGFFDVVAAEPAERIVENLVDEMQAEIARLRLTDAERKAIQWTRAFLTGVEDLSPDASAKADMAYAALSGLLERLK